MGERIRLRIKEITENMVWERVPERVQDSHKGTYGKVLCVVGSSRFRGAAALCTEGALRSGCGIVTLATVEPVFASVQPRMPEAILLSCSQSDALNEKDEWFGGIDGSEASKLRSELKNGYSALVIGPGMGNTDDTAALTKALVTDTAVTAVLDADALNALARKPDNDPQVRSGIFCVSGPSAGILEYSVDGAPFKELDTFTEWSHNLYIPWVYMLETELKDTDHKLVLRISKKKNPASQGTECQIRNFVVNGR